MCYGSRILSKAEQGHNVARRVMLAVVYFVDVKERQDRLPMMYWLTKLHKRPYKARFIANSSSCVVQELEFAMNLSLKLLTSCLTAMKAKDCV